MGRPLKWQANPLMQSIVQRNLQSKEQLHFLELQKRERYTWRKTQQRTHYRPLGAVESLFDSDGEYWCGRADLHQNFHVEIRTTLTDDELRERIVLVWTLMRHSHILLSCKTMYLHELLSKEQGVQWIDKCFVYDCPASSVDAIDQTRLQVSFVADHYPRLDARDFFHHARNTARALNSKVALSKLYVLPFKRTQTGTVLLHFVLVLAHQITDGLTSYRWSNSLLRYLNLSKSELSVALDDCIRDEANVSKLLPPAQEALYPQRSQNKARERWHWLLTRVLRHVRIPPPAAFQNPLRREHPLLKAEKVPPTYQEVLDYSETPPLNSGIITGDLTGKSVHNLRRLCREAGISIGSGLFTLVAMVMMGFEERRNPNTPLAERLPFVGSFPVNPRPFLSGEPTTGKENSCMLAFSDGVVLAFLPSDLDFVGRFKLLGRSAHKQLRLYQKRKQKLEDEVHLGSRSPSQLIPKLFCMTVERMEDRVDGARKSGIDVQGAFPAKVSPTLATCGISSVGDISGMLPPKANFDDVGTKDLVADFKSQASVVRPREGEFLVGASGSKSSFGYLVSYDANVIDPVKANEWKVAVDMILERDLFPNGHAKL